MENYAILLLDNTGFIACNARAEELFGVKSSQLLHRMPYQFSPEIQPDGSSSEIKARRTMQAAFDGVPQIFEWKHKKSDGALFDTEISLNRIDIEDKPTLLAILRDISPLKQAEESRHEMDQVFRSIVEFSHSGIFLTDEAFHITYANGMASQMVDHTNAEIVGHDFREFLDAESAALVADRYRRRMRGEEPPARYEFNIVRKDGDKRRVELSTTMFRDAAGHLKTVGQALDITERTQAEAALRLARENLELRVEDRTRELRQTNLRLENEITRREATEEALRRSEVQYRQLVENTDTIILEMDTQGRIAFLNRFAREFFGFSEAEILGRSVLGTIAPLRDTANADLEHMIKDIITNPQSYRLNENENIKRNGERVWIVWTNQPLFDNDGRLQKILCVGIDRTEIRKATVELEQKNRELAAANIHLEEMSLHKSQFLANMSHELRTPLNSIIGYTKLMLNGLEGDINEEQKKDLQAVYNNGKDLLELINGLLDLSRIEAGKAVLSYGVFNVADFLAETTATIEPLAREKGLTLTCLVAPGIKRLYADRAKTKQVLINILGNAVKFTSKGSIKLNITEDENHYIFSVSDTGMGIKKEDLESIFDSFVQVGPAQIAGYAGTGLGLAVSRQFIQMQGGRIWAESELGRGSTFTFTLPKEKVIHI